MTHLSNCRLRSPGCTPRLRYRLKHGLSCACFTGASQIQGSLMCFVLSQTCETLHVTQVLTRMHACMHARAPGSMLLRTACVNTYTSAWQPESRHTTHAFGAGSELAEWERARKRARARKQRYRHERQPPPSRNHHRNSKRPAAVPARRYRATTATKAVHAYARLLRL